MVGWGLELVSCGDVSCEEPDGTRTGQLWEAWADAHDHCWGRPSRHERGMNVRFLRSLDGDGLRRKRALLCTSMRSPAFVVGDGDEYRC